MNKIILCSISFICGGIVFYLNDNNYVNYLLNKNKNLSFKNEKLLYELNNMKKEKLNIDKEVDIKIEQHLDDREHITAVLGSEEQFQDNNSDDIEHDSEVDKEIVDNKDVDNIILIN